MLMPSVPQLSIIAIIVALIMGTKRLRDFGGDIGGMFRGIREGFKEAKGAATELAPEIRALKNDVQAVRESGQSIVTRDMVEYVERNGRD